MMDETGTPLETTATVQDLLLTSMCTGSYWNRGIKASTYGGFGVKMLIDRRNEKVTVTVEPLPNLTASDVDSETQDLSGCDDEVRPLCH